MLRYLDLSCIHIQGRCAVTDRYNPSISGLFEGTGTKLGEGYWRQIVAHIQIHGTHALFSLFLGVLHFLDRFSLWKLWLGQNRDAENGMTKLAVHRISRFSVFLPTDIVFSLHHVGVSRFLLLHHHISNLTAYFVTYISKMFLHGVAQPCMFIPFSLWDIWSALEKLVWICFKICFTTFCFKFRVCQVFSARSSVAWGLRSSETSFGGIWSDLVVSSMWLLVHFSLGNSIL